MSETPRTVDVAKSAKDAFAGPMAGALALVGRARNLLGRSGSKELQPAQRGALAPRRSPVRGSDISAPSTWAGRALRYSFIVVVAIPTLIAGLYFAFVASDEYVSETRVSVRAASEDKNSFSDTLSVFSKLGLSSGKATVEDSYIVLDYIKSQSIVEDIGGRPYLESKFSRPETDWFSRMSRNEPIEDNFKYWNKHVIAGLDTLSGIVTVRIYAFRPEDAQEIAKKIVALSETLVNKVSERSRAVAVSEAEADVSRNETALAAVRGQLQNFRNQTTSIDPVAKAESVGELIGKLMVERSDIVSTIASISGSLSNSSPALRFQQTRLESIDAQIADLQNQLTSTDTHAKTIAADLAKFEQLKLQEKFAEQKYTVSQTGLTKAEDDMRRQRLFLATSVPPGLPEYPLYPERGTEILLAFCACFVLWSILSMATASVVDHFA